MENLTINLTTSIETKNQEVILKAIKKSGINPKKIIDAKITRKSIDARKKEIKFNFAVTLILNKNNEKAEKIKIGNKSLENRPVIIGTGPAGLFCGYYLAKNGYKPIIFERGEKMEERITSVSEFEKNRILNKRSNIQFGEGGAGTFSDGKLTTRVKDKRGTDVLNIFYENGADESVLYLAKPHIGTDSLRNVIVNIRKKIIKMGGDIYFNSCLTDISIDKGKIKSIKINEKDEYPCNVLVLATGHSARDTFKMLYRKSIILEPKSFAIGSRIEHLQGFINEMQYGKEYKNSEFLPPADYSLAYNGNERSCFSFCMCPGGYVCAAASEEKTIVVNGMSNFKRDGKNANSALVTQVFKEEFQGLFGGMELQEKIERDAYNYSNSYLAPCQNVTDFLENRKTAKIISGIEPTYPIGTVNGNLNNILPEKITKTMKEALLYFNTKIKGFAETGILTGVETRTSSPLRITRNENFESISTKGLYPAGEGAGYAGGIMSAAIDGIKVAEKIIGEYKFN